MCSRMCAGVWAGLWTGWTVWRGGLGRRRGGGLGRFGRGSELGWARGGFALLIFLGGGGEGKGTK